jgi:hypothetical protein
LISLAVGCMFEYGKNQLLWIIFDGDFSVPRK